MPTDWYTHPILWAVASIPLWLAAWLWIRSGREEAKRRRLRRGYMARIRELAARYEGDVDTPFNPEDEEIYDESYFATMENK